MPMIALLTPLATIESGTLDSYASAASERWSDDGNGLRLQKAPTT